MGVLSVRPLVPDVAAGLLLRAVQLRYFRHRRRRQSIREMVKMVKPLGAAIA